MRSVVIASLLVAALTAAAAAPARAGVKLTCRDGAVWSGTNTARACLSDGGVAGAASGGGAFTSSGETPSHIPATNMPATGLPSPMGSVANTTGAMPAQSHVPATNMPSTGAVAAPPGVTDAGAAGSPVPREYVTGGRAPVPAMGGGPAVGARVWVSAATKTYYCRGATQYGRHAGRYMSEPAATAAGIAPAGSACGS